MSVQEVWTLDPFTKRLHGLAIMSAAYEVYHMDGLAGEFSSDVIYRFVSTGDGGRAAVDDRASFASSGGSAAFDRVVFMVKVR